MPSSLYRPSWTAFAVGALLRLLVALQPVAAAHAAEGPAVRPPDAVQRVRVGVREMPPLLVRDERGQLTGYLGEMLRLAEARSGVRFELVIYPTLEETLAAAQRGEVDAVAPLMRTPERERYLSFTRSMGTLGVAVIGRAESRTASASFAALAGKSVAVVRDGFVADAIQHHQPTARLLREPDAGAALSSLVLGRADYFVMELTQAAWQIRALGLSGLRVVGRLPISYKPAIAVVREQPWLHESLSAAVDAITESEREALVARWLMPPEPPWYRRPAALLALLVAVALLLLAGFLLAVYQRQLTLRRRQLYRADAMLKRASQAANLGAWEYDARRGRLHWTEQIFRIHGVQPERFEVTPRRAVGLMIDQDRPRLRAALQACLQQGHPFSIELRAQRPDGECRWLLITGDAERDDGGRIVRLFGTVRDIDAIKRQRLDLERSEKMYRTLADNVSDVITIHLATPGGEYVYVTPSIFQVTGYRPEELVGRMPHLLMHDDDRDAMRRYHERVLAGDFAGNVTYRHQRREGGWVWLETRAEPVHDEHGQAVEIVAVSRDATERVAANEALRESENRYRHLALHDSLTGLPNREAFVQRLDEALARAAADAHPVALCFLDTDNFKHINDSRGHTAGDGVLREIGARLAREMSDAFYVARLGGDEFVALIERGVVDATAQTAADRLLGAFARPLDLADGPVYLTASIGLAFYPQHGADAETLLSAADTAMYAAKDAGRNTWRVYNAGMGAALSRKARALQNVRGAFERDELMLHYQPRVDLHTGACAGVEALLRWRRTDGTQGPAQLIEAAEESGFITKLGEWVIGSAAVQSRAWRARGTHCPISVNVSVKQLQDDRFLPFLREQTRTDPALAQYLELEITESALARDAQHAMRVLRELKQMGFRLHIDDFGTGYSSLSYLSQMPVDTLKIDRSFVAGVPSAREAREIVRSIMALGRSIEVGVIAEGVETAEQAAFLREHGCGQAQGFYFAQPVDADAALAFVRANGAEAGASQARSA